METKHDALRQQTIGLIDEAEQLKSKINYANRIAESMEVKIDLKTAKIDLFEILGDLNSIEDEEPWESFNALEDFVKEIACLLANPAISNKLKQAYYKNHAGELLMKMMTFFERMKDNDNVQNYLIYMELKHRSNSLTHGTIKGIEEHFLKEAV